MFEAKFEESRRMVREEMERLLEKMGMDRKGSISPDDEQPPTN